jgi:endonuclease/exonuclease/phosphatase family metal-dependent hydrolase
MGERRVVRTAALLGTLAVLAAACTRTDRQVSGPSVGARMQLRVMTFNIEYGGEGVDFSSVPKAIAASGADVVGIEESYGNVPKVAAHLGWNYFDVRLAIVSRYPLLDPPDGNGRYTFVEVSPGKIVAIGNVHLPSSPYGPNLVRDGATPEELLAKEDNSRVPAVQPVVDALKPLADAGIPTFLTGDFNTPSHLDWTDAMVGSRPQMKYAFDWPVGEIVEGAGFVDSYRAVHPDPATNAGITWPAARPHEEDYNPGENPNAPRDRIDFIYAGGQATATNSAVVGEEGGDGVSIAVTPWPSDHRAVVSTFDVTPATPPVLVTTTARSVGVGDELDVSFHAPGVLGEQVAIVAAGGVPSDAVQTQPTGDGAPIDGSLTFSTDGWDLGPYEAVLVDAAGVELSRYPFWVEAPDGLPVIATGKQTYEEGEPIDVSWHGAPGNRWDWVGIYKRGADPNVAWYILWLYTDATIDGSAVFDKTAHGGWPLKPGSYSVYLLQDDSYELLASGDLTIAG